MTHNRYCYTVHRKLPPVIGVPRGCCGHASGILLPRLPWFAGCATHATPCYVPGHPCCTLCCLTSYIAASRTSFFVRVFAGCFRLRWAIGNKNNEPQSTKSRPEDEHISYVVLYSLNLLQKRERVRKDTCNTDVSTEQVRVTGRKYGCRTTHGNTKKGKTSVVPGCNNMWDCLIF